MAIHFKSYTISDLRNETADCISVAFDIPENDRAAFAFRAGQNLTVRTFIDGKEVRRSYSLCSSPHEAEWRIAIKRISGGAFSQFAHTSLQIGQSLELLPPSGNFFVKPNGKPRHYLAFAAGSGITPILGQLTSILATEPKSRFTLVYGNRDIQSMIFRETLEGIKNRYMDRFTLIPVFSRTKMDAAINQGRIDVAKCQLLFRQLISLASVDEFLLCGPTQMIFNLRDYLVEQGVPRDHIHFELFNAPDTPAVTTDRFSAKTGDVRQSDISVHVDGIRYRFPLAWNGNVILDEALAQGADLPFSCKGGVCASCRAKVLEGQVEMEVNYALERDELDAGFVLTCQSHPRSDRVVLDFDAK